jgi:hypothetical protein
LQGLLLRLGQFNGTFHRQAGHQSRIACQTPYFEIRLLVTLIHILLKIETEYRSVSKRRSSRLGELEFKKRAATNCRAFLMTQGRVHRCFPSPKTFPASYAE